MANKKHLAILKQGVEAWNKWRKESPEIRPDLSGAGLSDADLRGANLRGANLSGSNLSSANLNYANLSRASLSDTDLSVADISRANLSRANLSGSNLSDADIRGADISRASLFGVEISRANLRGANLFGADISRANLSDADLSGANLSSANLSGSNLSSANLSDSNFSSTILQDADFAKAIVGSTVFADTDLSLVKGLDSVRHDGPSTIGIDTIYKSKGQIPEAFLRGCGVPEDFITYSRSLVGKAIEFCSCFISYSTKDEDFARRLHSRMQDAKLRVWFAPEDIKGGQKTIEQLERAIQVHDRLLIVLSEQSMQSEWVMTEIRKARKAEIKEKRRKLFPIRLVDFETIKDWECFDADTGKDLAAEVREYHIPDFSNWKEHDSFEEGFSRLLRDLKAEESH